MNRSLIAIIGFIAGLLVLPLVIYLYIAFGHPPVAAVDKPFPLEARIAAIPLHKPHRARNAGGLANSCLRRRT